MCSTAAIRTYLWPDHIGGEVVKQRQMRCDGDGGCTKGLVRRRNAVAMFVDGSQWRVVLILYMHCIYDGIV